MYQVTAQISYTYADARGASWNGTRQVPTFYLSEQVQGIVSPEHAERIALTVINPLADVLTTAGITNVMVNCDAVRVTVGPDGEIVVTP